MKKLFLVWLTLWITTSASAQVSDHEQKRLLAKEILEAQGSVSQMQKLGTQMGSIMNQQFATMIRQNAPHLTVAQQQRASEVMSSVVSKELSSYITGMMPPLLSSMENLYVNRFSLEELREVHRFATSPVAKKNMQVVIDDLPALMAPIMNEAAMMGQKIAPKIAQAFRELEKEGISLQRK
jgi:hypothetical protein